MKKKKLEAEIYRLERSYKKLCVERLIVGRNTRRMLAMLKSKVETLHDEIAELSKKRLSEGEISDVADRVYRRLTEDR